jgi:probable HAF family extracellular repeat protein
VPQAIVDFRIRGHDDAGLPLTGVSSGGQSIMIISNSFLLRALRFTVALGALALGILRNSTAQSFQWVGEPALGEIQRSMSDMSPDGKYIIGIREFTGDILEGFIWSQESGVIGIGELPGGSHTSYATGISDVGSIIVGASTIAGTGPGTDLLSGFRWTPTSGMTAIGELEVNRSTWISEISGDGNVVVGYGLTSALTHNAFRWTADSGFLPIPPLYGAGNAALDVSHDGSIVVGYNFLPNLSGTEAFKWSATGGMVPLGDLPGGIIESVAYAISSDGSTIVGEANVAPANDVPFRWTEATGMIDIGDLPGGARNGQATAVSADGTFVGGWTDSGNDYEFGFIWSEEWGIRSVRVLLAASGANMAGIQLGAVKALSADGRTAAGDGRRALGGQYEPWIATIPEPPKSDFNDDNLLDCTDVDPLVAAIAGGSHPETFDLTGDNQVDGDDLTEWLRVAGAVNNFLTGAPILLGDANLDGVVDGSDFGIWNSSKFTTNPAWCSGDFNSDGFVDGSDFGIWNANKFTSADTSLVPEPASLSVLALAALILHRVRDVFVRDIDSKVLRKS